MRTSFREAHELKVYAPSKAKATRHYYWPKPSVHNRRGSTAVSYETPSRASITRAQASKTCILADEMGLGRRSRARTTRSFYERSEKDWRPGS